jgi:hypothetical protein
MATQVNNPDPAPVVNPLVKEPVYKSPAYNPDTSAADVNAEADPAHKSGAIYNVNSDALHRGDPGRTVDAAIVFNLDPAAAMAIAPVYADEVPSILAANPELKLMRDPNTGYDKMGDKAQPYGRSPDHTMVDYGVRLMDPELVRRIQESRGLCADASGSWVPGKKEGKKEAKPAHKA